MSDAISRSSPEYLAAAKDVREWVYVYLLALKADAQARAEDAKEAGDDRAYRALSNRAGAYFHAATMILTDAHLNPHSPETPDEEPTDAES